MSPFSLQSLRAEAASLRLLLAQDSTEDAERLGKLLGGLNLANLELCTAGTLRETLEVLDRWAVDLVLLDLQLPDSAGIQTLERVVEAHPEVPVIVLTGLDDVELAARAIRSGAQDSLVKRQLDGGSLTRALRRAAVHRRADQAVQISRSRAEQQLLQEQKMEGIGRLAGGVAHDFNNLVTAISGYSDLCLASVRKDDPVREYLEEIKSAGARGATLARQLLAFSRRQVLEPKVLDLNQVVAETERPLRRLIGDDIRLTAELATDLPPVKADPGQLEQVIVDLAVNARDAMPQGGELVLGTARVDLTASDAEHYAFPVRAGTYVRVSVQDTGIGMREEIRSRVFEPFFTTKDPGVGTGLGLSAAYGVIKQTGGYISVDSEPGRGTRVEILLPEVVLAPDSSAGRRAENGGSRGRETILVVEDEAPLRRLLVQILLRAGYTVIEATEGHEALELCNDLGGTLDLVITDVVMPDMGGPALAAELAILYPATKILFISGYPGDTVVRRGELSPGHPFLQKPFDQETLLGTVRNLLDGPS